MKSALIEPLESRYAPAAVIGVTGPGTINESAGSVTFTVSLSEASPDPISVSYDTVAGTATEGVDYVGAHDLLTFQPGETSKDIVVGINDDTTHESNEDFSLTLRDPSGAQIGGSTSSLTILDDDPVPTLSVDNVSQAEGNAQNPMSFTFHLSAPSSQDVTFHLATSDGTATSGSDFTSVDTDFTIEAGLTTKSFAVTINGDTTSEQNEDFSLNVSNVLNANPSILQATGTIVDDDTAGRPTVSVASNVETTEGPSSLLTFTVSLSQAATSQVTVDYATTNGTALVGSDYTALPGTPLAGTLTFAPGEISKTVSISVLDDTIHESDESLFFTLSNPTNADPGTTQGIGTIHDNDLLALSVSAFGQQGTSFSVNEGDSGAQQYLVTLHLSSTNLDPVVVHVASQDGTATAGSDYVAISQDVTFAPGETTKTVALTINGDTTDELNETLQLMFTGASLGPQTPATITLLNDEHHITVGDKTIVEGNSGTSQMTFDVTLDSASDHAISLDYITADGTATAGSDYTALPLQTLTFAPGETVKHITVDIAGDTNGEPDEFFSVNFSNVHDALINKTSVHGNITNDDSFITISNGQAIEGAAGTTTMMQFTVTVQRMGADIGQTVMVPYLTSATGQATEGTDYTKTTGALTFAANETTKTISVPIIGDSTPESDETFTLKLQTDLMTGLSANAAFHAAGTGTIIDDEGLITISDATIVEGDSGTSNMAFVVSIVNRAGAGGNNINVHYSTLDGTAVSTGVVPDFTAVSGDLTFASGVSQQTILVPIRGDLLHEGDQTFSVQLSTSTPSASFGKSSASGTIIDNDGGSPSLSISGGSVVEGDAGGTQQLAYTVSLANGGEGPVTVQFGTQDGTANVGADYTATTKTLVFYPGDTTQTVLVPIVGDTTVEANETVTGVLSNAQGATIATTSATGKILDDDISASIAGFTITEGDNGTKTATMSVTLSAQPLAGQDVTVNFGVTGGTATAGTDYSLATTSPLKFTSNDASLTKTITFNIVGDTVNEANETINVALSSVDGGKIGTGTATGTITDDDAVAVSISDATITEGDTGTKTMDFTVTLNKTSQQSVTVLASTAPGTALAGSDFTAISNQTITFAPGETTKTFSVNITGDTVDEQTETLSAVLSAPTVATLGRSTGTGTILDNDARSLGIGDAKLAEGESGTNHMDFTVSLSSAATQDIDVDFTTANGTAIAGQDYVAQAGTLHFAAGELTKTISITINGDTTVEPDETFAIHLANPVNAKIADGDATGTIQSDETTYKLVPVTGSGPEDNPPSATTLTFKVVREGDLTRAGTVSFATADGTAISTGAFADYNPTSGTLSFAPGEDSKVGSSRVDLQACKLEYSIVSPK